MPTPRRPRAALLLLLAVPPASSACRSWQRVPVARTAVPTPARVVRGPVRVTLADGRRLALGEARLGGDSLRGPAADPGAPPGEVRVALDSVRRLEARRLSGRRTGALAAGVVLGLLGLAVVGLAAAGPGLPSY